MRLVIANEFEVLCSATRNVGSLTRVARLSLWEAMSSQSTPTTPKRYRPPAGRLGAYGMHVHGAK